MPASGKKRSRKAEEEDSKKKAKAAGESPIKRSPGRAAATPTLAASPAASTATTRPSRKAAASTKSAPRASKQQKEEDTLGNPYEQQADAAVMATKKKAPLKKTKTKETTNKTTTEPVVNGSVQVEVTHGKRKRILPISILLLLVAILMWCTVTLVGMLLSERMDHELHVWHMRDLLHNSEQVQVPSLPQDVEELQKEVHNWKGRAEQLESQKKGMLQEFGEKLVNLEYME